MTTSPIRIHLFKHGSDEFLERLRQEDIEYQERKSQPGVVIAGPGVIEIFNAVAPLGGIPALAFVIVQWLKSRAARRIIITDKDGNSVTMEGFGKEDVKEMLVESVAALLSKAKEVAVIQTEPDND